MRGSRRMLFAAPLLLGLLSASAWATPVPENPEARILVHLRDASRKPVCHAELIIQVQYEEALDQPDDHYDVPVFKSDSLVPVSPPPISVRAIVTIRAENNGVLSPEKIVLTNADYWNMVSVTKKEYALEKTFTVPVSSRWGRACPQAKRR